MHDQLIRKLPVFFRPTFCVIAGVGLFISSFQVLAQRPQDDQARRGMGRIDHGEGERRLAAFRDQRLQGDYVFEFQLEHKPRRARTVRYDGIMWGTWNEQGALTRFKILPRDEKDSSKALVELIVQNGPEPSAWARQDSSGDFKRVEGAALFKPLLPELVYTIFDLQMPFIYWDEFVYEGPVLAGASRVAQNFRMIPPEGSESARQGIKAVRIGLDDDYNALLRIEIIGEGDVVRSEFGVRSFKKVQEQYIVKKISLTDNESKDRTDFNVIDAAVGLHLDDDVFDLPLTSPVAVESDACGSLE